MDVKLMMMMMMTYEFCITSWLNSALTVQCVGYITVGETKRERE